MSTLKIVAIVLLNLFLSLSLVVFGFAFTINMTALNADYVTSQLDDLPVSSLVEEAEFGEIIEDNPELADLIEDVIIENETELKERAGEAIHIVYDYLEGRSQSLDLALTLRDTVLDPDFTITIIEQADFTPLIEEMVAELIAEVELPYGLSVGPHLDDIAQELELWAKQQAAIAVPPIYDYILGQSQSLDVVISLEPVKEILKDTLKQDFFESPPPEFSGLSPAELEQEFDTLFEEFAADIDSTLEIGEELTDSEMPSQVAESLEDAEEALGEAQRYIGYFNLGYGLLIGFIVLLILGIILIYREVKGATRTLGAAFLTYGIINLIAVFVARGLARPPIARLDIPLSLQTWLTQLINSSLTPLLVLAIVLLIVGAALLTVFFIYRRRQTPMETEKPL